MRHFMKKVIFEKGRMDGQKVRKRSRKLLSQ